MSQNGYIGMERYPKLEKMGEGTYGTVYKAQDKVTKEIVALKKVHWEYDEEGIPKSALREIVSLKTLCHPNIISLRDVVHENQKLYLVLEFMDNDLKRYLDGMDKVSDHATTSLLQAYFLRQLLQAVDFCHARGIMHRDLKPQNILVDRHGTLKVADFGQGRMFDKACRTWTHEVCTLWYRAPEILIGSRQYSTAADMWSVGCICAEVLTRKPLFTGDSEIDQLFRIFRVLGTPNEESWPGVTALADYSYSFPQWQAKTLDQVLTDKCSSQVIDLIAHCLVLDPSKRISAREALAHPYFDGIRAIEALAPSSLHTSNLYATPGAATLTSAIDAVQQAVVEYQREEVEKVQKAQKAQQEEALALRRAHI